jgi:PiT family inorganic phosphate transporter
VSTKVLTPRLAVAWASFWNLVGALSGTAVASTIGKGLVDTNAVTMTVLLCALLSAIVWGLLTWWLGLPSSSSHALIGGLCGATLAGSGRKLGRPALVDGPLAQGRPADARLAGRRVLRRHAAHERSSWCAFSRVRPRIVSAIFGKAQLASAGFMGFSHGSNDAQKTMGIVTLTLFTATRTGLFRTCPPGRVPAHPRNSIRCPSWIVVTCAVTMAAGTAGGGMRIIRTMGQKLVKLQPVQGFAAETTAALVIYGASDARECPSRRPTSSRPRSWAWARPSA